MGYGKDMKRKCIEPISTCNRKKRSLKRDETGKMKKRKKNSIYTHADIYASNVF